MFSFSDIIGQEEAKQRLLQEVAEGRIAHALLFTGPEGSGKLPMALAYARYLTCQRPTPTDACGTCPSCAKWEKLIHPDVHFVFPIVAKKAQKKEVCDDYLPAWRKLLSAGSYFSLSQWLDEMDAENSQAIIYARESDEMLRKLSLKSSQGGYKVVLMWLPEKMNEVCANKLLKLLEEPPAQTVFLLVSEAPEQLLATILSRTQRFHLPRLDESVIAQTLQSRFGVLPEESRNLAHIANGSMIQALAAIQLNQDATLFFDHFVSLMRLAYQRKIREMKHWSEELASMGRERQKNFLNYCQRLVRENFIFNLRRPEMNYMTATEQQFAQKFAPFINERNVFGMMEELSLAQIHIEQNVNPRMVFFDFALKMIMLLKQ
ncbi:MAG: ATP-binding protein [Bacteroides sp.]